MKIINEIVFFVFPLLFSGLIHHLIIIKYNLLQFISKPVDFNIKLGGAPLFGKSKTWRGILLVPILSSIGSVIISQIITIQTTLPPFLIGLLIGLGYAIAELPNSFIKRRFNIKSGEISKNTFRYLFLLIDQVDSVIGAILVMLLIYPISLTSCFYIFIIGSLLHILVDIYLNKFGYKKLRNNQHQS